MTDRPKIELSGGAPVTDDHCEINPFTKQQKGYIVLSAEERAKGFVRPVRLEYTHLTCERNTIMARDIAETLARDPKFYNGGFCFCCKGHFPRDEFVWKDTQERVGS